MDSIENLRTFIAAADAGSLAAAARHLGLAASVVTKRIDQLELRTQARVFTRTTRHVVLTEFGARYLPSARRLVHDHDMMFAVMNYAPQQVEGHIRIRAPTPMAVGFLGETFARFLKQYPRVSLDVVLNEPRLVNNPLEEGLDISISGSPNSYAGVIDEPICPLNKLVCAAPTYLQRRGTPRHPRELSKHACLVFTPFGNTWHFESPTGPVSVDLRPRLCATDQFVLTAAAIRGNGIALLASYAAGRAIREGTLIRVLDRYAIPTVWIKALVPEARASSPHVRSLLDFLKTEFAPLPPWDRES
jgi:DNA-binding transcriptional LysR family regulator